jgi:NAD(P)-dependent dehydrogenase (short-subunit alcohol dehydrogenase family)
MSYLGKVAVITGAASGIGKELARLGARKGMKLVLADLSIDGLDVAAHELTTTLGLPSDHVVTCRTDVSKSADVEALAAVGQKAFGAPHYVFNNAGVAGSSGLIWENTEEDWKWMLGANLWSVVHGVRVFTPLMLKEAARDSAYRGRIVNTASMAGLSSMPLAAMYNVSKHGVITLTETLHHDLNLVTDQVKASVLCPFFIPTAIGTEASGHRDAKDLTPSQMIGHVNTMRAVSSGKISAETVAHQVFDGMDKGDFYVFTHPGSLISAKERIHDILEGNQPTDPYRAKPEIGAALKAAIRKSYDGSS